MILKRTTKNKECQFLVVNKRSGAILWFLKKYPSQRCGTFVIGWYFMSNNRHFSFFIGKHTFQNQKPAARLITVLDIEFQSLHIFWNFEGSHCWPLDKKWPLKLVLYSIYHYKSYYYKCKCKWYWWSCITCRIFCWQCLCRCWLHLSVFCVLDSYG